ncbi:cation:proton antiporter [bacterium]|nr:cation:proton antiporter [bacterium]
MSNVVFNISAIIALSAVLLATFRLFKGPTVADCVVSLDVMTIITISLMAFIAMFAGRIIYLDVALVYALMSFLGVVAVARYIEGGF